LLGQALTEEIDLLAGQSGAQLIAQREARFLAIGG
jgi:acetyl-CoA carboxylase carboxyl transferase subunit alpha